MPKTTFLLKIENNDAMLLSASFIASGALHDDCTQNLVLEVKISENLDFCQYLKIEFTLHICCRDYDLSNITNWQHINARPSGRNFCRNFWLLIVSHINFHLYCRFFSGFDKINNFWQQKQQMLFLSNMTPKVLPT